jgi:hypothetical protein
MCLRVLRVSEMPCNVEIWIDDGVDCFTIYIDKKLITEQGAIALQRILRTTVLGWQRVDNAAILRTLRAVTG